MGADQPERPEPIGWEELLTRLSTRRGAVVEGDRVRLWWRPRQRLKILAWATMFLSGIAWVWLFPAPGSSADDRIGGTVAGGLVIAVLLMLASIRRPVVEIDERGVTKGRVTVPWADISLVEVHTTGRSANLLVVVDPGTGAFDRLPSWVRRLRVRGARAQAVWGVRVPVADSRFVPLEPHELGALLRHPASTHHVRPPGRPEWGEEISGLAGAEGVRVDGRSVRFTDADGERLRIDDTGIHGRMPGRSRSVSWEGIDRLGLIGGTRHAALLLHLREGTRLDPVNERGWKWLGKKASLAVPIPLRGLPVDGVSLTGLILAHPHGKALWERGRQPPD